MEDAAASTPNLNGFPVLVLYGERDEIIPRDSFCRILKMRSGQGHEAWRVAVYPEGYHMLTRDLQADVVLKDIAAWIGNPAAPLPSGRDAPPDATEVARLCL
jgi:alpha-beta hydrolase superfamily lysophospholipase